MLCIKVAPVQIKEVCSNSEEVDFPSIVLNINGPRDEVEGHMAEVVHQEQ